MKELKTLILLNQAEIHGTKQERDLANLISEINGSGKKVQIKESPRPLRTLVMNHLKKWPKGATNAVYVADIFPQKLWGWYANESAFYWSGYHPHWWHQLYHAILICIAYLHRISSGTLHYCSSHFCEQSCWVFFEGYERSRNMGCHWVVIRNCCWTRRSQAQFIRPTNVFWESGRRNEMWRGLEWSQMVQSNQEFLTGFG